MPLHDSKRMSLAAYPAIATAAVLLFLLRNRQITNGSSPGSGVTIAVAELLVRASAIVHWAASVGAHAFSLLLRVAAAPAIFVLSTVETELRVGIGAADCINAVLQHAALYLMNVL